ncbi:MAG: hypothetical protein AAGI68_00665 [Planctomycetota bacterium]
MPDRRTTRSRRLRRLSVRLRRLHRNRAGSTSLEFALLLAVITLPGYFIIRLGLETLHGHYRMITELNALPIP